MRTTDTRRAAAMLSGMVKIFRTRARVITKSWSRRECGLDPNGVNEQRLDPDLLGSSLTGVQRR
jgi:hypothetical protein